MSRFFVGLALWALLLALAACGGDSKGTDPKDAELAEMVDTVVSTFEDLTVCTGKREGATAYVEDEDSAYVCKKGLWVVDDSLTKAVRPDSEKKSSNGKSSSSGKNNPSSPVASPCKTEAADNCEYGTLTDDRDGQTYKTVKIGEQWWMAENLNYRYIQQTAEEDSSSYCYNDDPANCAKYGRLYLRSAAMIVCPEGWHLPDTTEWNALFTAVGGKATAGTMLKFTEGWKNNGNGSDTYFFSALPAGYRDYGGDFYDEGNGAYFWSSTEFDSNDAYSMYLRYYDVSAYLYVDNKYYGFSVRCLKDYGPDAEKKSSNDKSSSSEKNSSSSSVVPTNSSSSSVVPTVSVASPCKTATENNCEYGTLTDDRDGQTYKTVKIGEQWWMAENLNYAYTGVPYKEVLSTDSNLVYYSDSTSWCYNNDAANCAKYGRLYTWAAAMDSAGIIPGNTANACGCGEYCNLGNVKVRGLCPDGWHLPDTTEWSALFNAVGRKATAGEMLKSTEGWKNSGNGSDAYFFSALPAGVRVRNSNGDFNCERISAFFWSSTEYGSNYAYPMNLNYTYGNADPNCNAYRNYSYKGNGFSVRCLRD
jgi:Fibrobacter succinogenes major domain (Fib_succ_major).